jgi:hypothetical protein
MFKKFIYILFCHFALVSLAKAQKLRIDTAAYTLQDSLGISTADSATLKVIDTITPKFLKPLDSAMVAQITDSLNTGFGGYEKFNLQKLIAQNRSIQAIVKYFSGNELHKGQVWILGIIAFLLVLFAILKNTFAKQLSVVIQSFYSNRALTNLNKEENLLTSWSFLLLFIQFGFTIGMFFYLVAQYKGIPDVKDGFKFFFVISVATIVLYLLKILILRLIGTIFNIQKPLNEYVSILYLSYFNASLLFIPLVISFALSPLKYGSVYIALGITLLVLIFAFQFVRAGINILSQYRFPKVYLILYFCTLEICPILILIKAIGL